MAAKTKIKLQFAQKFISKYFLYGYLCLLGSILSVLCGVILFRELYFPIKFLSLFCLVPFGLSFAQFMKIAISTPYKFKYYKISLYRLRTRGFKDEYFECEMHEPCLRLIIKDIFLSNGYKKEYANLKEKCKGTNIRLEKAKERLLAKVKREHEKATSVV